MYKFTELKNVFAINSLCTVFHQDRNEDYYFNGERHNMWELVIVTKGKIGVTADNNVFILNTGQAIIHKPWEFHRLWSEKTASKIMVFTFTADNMPEFQEQVFEITDMGEPIKIADELKRTFEFNHALVTGIKKDKITEAHLTIKHLETFILDTIINRNNSFEDSANYGAQNYTSIINILKDNINRSLTLDEIAGMCNMSRSNLTKTFSKYAGMGVISYFNQLKIDKAVPLLKSGIPINEISDMLGFANQNYFCTVFKKIKGKSPSYYKYN